MIIFELLNTVCRRLEEVNIDYMLSGSLALNIYCTSRATRDVDIVVNLKEEHVNDFIALFKEENYLDEETVKEEIKSKGIFNIINFATGYKIDFIIRKNTEYRRLEFERRKRKNFKGTDLWVVSPEDLIISKIIWIQDYFSEIQKMDIEDLLLQTSPDLNYVHEWAKKLNLKTYGLI